jgi:hypothetical protein
MKIRRLDREVSYPEIPLKLGCRKRLGIEKALGLLALLVEQKCRLSVCLDTFGNDFEAEIVRHGDQ